MKIPKKTPADKRALLVERAMRLAWSSLSSHLPHTHKRNEKKFDKTCVKEYAELIHILSKLY